MEKPLPYISAALLAETIIEDKSGSITVVRIADRVEYQVQGLPAGYKPVINIKGLLSLKSGPAKGEFKLRISIVRPNGEQQGNALVLPDFVLRGGDHGQNFILNFGIGVQEEGLHWFDVYLDEVLLTRIPLMIVQTQEARET